MCQYGEQIKLIKDLGISEVTFRCWKKEFGLPIDSKYSDSEKLELMEKYYKIKQINPKLNVTDIAKRLNISSITTLLNIQCPRRMINCGPGIAQRIKEQKELMWNTP
uniref:Transposase n=1 Tax=Globodera rostochiensis TaxID=31243 RepID=A0A914H9E5_GLORO